MSRLAALREAEDIYQAHLDALSEALLTGNAEAFAAGISLPHSISCEDSYTVVETHEEMIRIFNAYHRTLTSQGVTEQARIVTKAEFVTPDVIIGEHETHIMRDGLRLVEPYPNRVRLDRIDGGWYETKAANGVKCDGNRMLMPQPSHAIPDLPNEPHFEPKGA